MLLPLLAVLTMMHYEGDVAAAGGDYVDVAFVVPPGTVEIQIVHTDGSASDILDWGVWSPEGFRGWGGGNTEDAIIGVAQSSRSYLPGAITPGTWTVSIGKAQLDADGGRYSIDVICRDNATLAVRPKATPAPVVLATGRRWYKGDFHVHSSESGDANASFDQISALARQRGLDFVNLSDHNTSSHLALAAEAQKALTDVLLLRGAEITTYAGHGNAVGLGTYVDHRIGHMGRTIAGVLTDVEAAGAIFIVNHPTLDLGENCIGCPWGHDATTPWDKVAGMEIITGKWDIVERLFVPSAIAKWDGLLDEGHRIAAIGGSDDHRAGTGTGITDTPLGSPTTLVLADELSEAAIMKGIREGRTIVQMKGPDDPFVEIKIGTAEIGDSTMAGTANVAAHVTGGTGHFLQ
ncbi:MAG: CehA/McbA family metallohydrolase, partial [Deltaproteobacteria bacterium]|nr:CehA/McbA family metallohydrolase [Deltaproteobacteria bacterium]